MTKVAITGGAGYLGAILIEHLLANGHEVTVLDNVNSPRSILMKFDKMERKQYEIFVNGASQGNKMRDELYQGLSVGL